MRIIVLTNSQGNQKALIHKLSKVCDISAVVFSDNIPRRKPKKIASARGFVNSVGGRFLAPEFRNVWNKASATQSLMLGLRDKKEKGEIKEIGLVNEPYAVTGCYLPNDADNS